MAYSSLIMFVTLFASGIAVTLVLDDVSDERETFDSILRVQQSHRTYTPRKCCKVGIKAAEMGLSCVISFDVIEDRNNDQAYRDQMKPTLSSAFGSRRLHYKNLLYSVEKCNPTKHTRSMFLKCCSYQEELIRAIESCDELSVPEERQECKRLANRTRK